MSHGNRAGPSQSRQSTNTTGRAGTPASMTPRERKKKRLDDAVNNAITIAKIAKDTGETIPLLAPLKASMGIVITLLEIVKDVRKCEEDWETLSNYLATRIKLLQDHLANKPANVESQELITEYKEALDKVVQGIEPLARKHKTWFQSVVSAKNDEDRIKDSIREMEEAFNIFTTKIQLQVHQDVSQIQAEQESIHREVVEHRADHSKSHARILKVQEMQGNMNQTIENMNTEQRETRSKLTETEETILLNTLSAASFANGDEHEVCLKGTRVPILEQARSWLMNENGPQIFWLADVAGSGKSTVANHLAREWKRQGQLAGRFFFSRAAEQTRTTTYFFSTIAQQGLSQLGPKVRSAISDGIRDMSNPVAAPLEDQCRVLFAGPLTTLSSPIVLILDALDECEPSMLTRMLRVLLPQLGNLPHLRLFVTSRPDNHIIESLETFQVYRTSLRDDIESNRMDIWTFLGEKLKSISIPQSKIDRLVARSEGLFIWASTVCKILLKYRDDKDQFLEEVLVQGPEQMDSLYHVALQQALSDSSIPNNIKVYKRVLSVIVVALEPLSPNTINRLLNIRNTFEIVGDLQSVLDCHHPDDPVRFLHPTFREFLLRPLEHNPYRINEDESHLSLAHACMDIMAADLRWDICDLDRQPIEDDKDRAAHQSRFITCTTHALRYSCHFWSGHLSPCGTARILNYKDIPTRLEQFFQNNLLDWMYIISFIKSVKEPWVLLRRFIAARLNERLTTWANDASRFLKIYYLECQSRPLDVYYHFAFAPKSTIFQKIYSKSEFFPHPVVTMGLEDDWPSHTSIKTHNIDTQCLSPCGNWLVTGGRDSNPVYGVWNVELADGETNVHPCGKNSCSVHDVLLSYDHNHQLQLHTICRCNAIFRWNLSNSFHTLLDETRLDPDEEYYKWSDDGNKVLTRNWFTDRNSLWKRETPASYFQILGCLQDDWSFSPGGGDKLAHWTLNRLEMWDCSGMTQFFSKIFDGPVRSIQFSPNGKTVVVVQATLVHCISSLHGETIWSMMGSHVNIPMSIEFTSDGQRIIYYNDDNKEAVIVDASNGCLLATNDFKEPSSSDSTLLIIPGEEQALVLHDPWMGCKISLWNPFNGSGVQHLAESTIEIDNDAEAIEYCMSWQHRVLVETYWGGNTIVFRSLQFSCSTPPPAPPLIVETWVSPTGEYLVILTETPSIQVWNCKLGTKIMDYNLTYTESWVNKIDFDEHDPSRFLYWNSESLCAFDIKQCVVKEFSIDGPIAFATFHSSASSLGILTIMSDGAIYFQPWDSSSRELICRISSPLRDIKRVAVSPTNNTVAIVQPGVLAIKELSRNGRESRWPGAWSEVRFALDGTNIITLEDCDKLKVISHVRLSDFAITHSWTLCTRLNQEVPFDPEHFFYAIQLDQSSAIKGGCIYHHALYSSNGYIASIGTYEDEFGCSRYGQCQLRCSLYGYYHRSSAKNVIARLENGNLVVVVDMSLWANHFRSKPGFIDRVYPWKYNWPLQCQEFVQYHRKLDEVPMKVVEKPLAEFIRMLIDLAEFERRTRELKTWGSLQEVLCKLEVTGWDGSMKNVDVIRSNPSIMSTLEELWRDGNLTGIQELRRGIDKKLRRSINELLQEIQKGFFNPYYGSGIRLLSFIYIYQLRADKYDYRRDWERLYKEIQKIATSHQHYSSEEEEWLNWMKANTTLNPSEAEESRCQNRMVENTEMKLGEDEWSEWQNVVTGNGGSTSALSCVFG